MHKFQKRLPGLLLVLALVIPFVSVWASEEAITDLTRAYEAWRNQGIKLGA